MQINIIIVQVNSNNFKPPLCQNNSNNNFSSTCHTKQKSSQAGSRHFFARWTNYSNPAVTIFHHQTRLEDPRQQADTTSYHLTPSGMHKTSIAFTVQHFTQPITSLPYLLSSIFSKSLLSSCSPVLWLSECSNTWPRSPTTVTCHWDSTQNTQWASHTNMMPNREFLYATLRILNSFTSLIYLTTQTPLLGSAQ